MKPSDLIGTRKLSASYIPDYRQIKAYGLGKDLRALNPLFNKDCIVGYFKCMLGIIFVIKTKYKYMAFYHNKYGDGHTFGRVFELDYIIAEIKKEGKIVDKTLYKDIMERYFPLQVAKAL